MNEPGAQSSGPQTRRDAAFRIVLAEMGELFTKVESLLGSMQAVDKSTKETARSVQEALHTAKKVVAAIPDKPVEMIQPKNANPLVAVVVASVVSGIVAGSIVAGGMWLSSKDRDDAKVGRAVMAAFPSLDAATQAKLQVAINKTPQ